MASATVGNKPSGRRIIAASAFGNALEFFDFGVYNFFVVYIGTLFFPPSSDENLGLLLAFATFGVSFFMRPIGGILIGAYADRFGRRNAMILTISTMSLGTLLLGCAPTYATAGYWGTAILVGARLIQGFAAGGEVGASMSMLVESAPKNRRGYYSSWALATQGLATTFGGVVALTLTTFLPDLTGNVNVMGEWGWRIPFFIGVLLAPIGCWLRISLENDMGIEDKKDNKSFEADVKVENEKVLTLLRENIKVIVTGVLLTIGATVGTYITLYYYGTFSVKYLDMSASDSYSAMLLAGVLTFVVGLISGHLCDRIGRKKLILFSRLSIFILAYPSFWLLVNYPTKTVLLMIVAVMVIINTVGCVAGMLVSSELFPKRIRALGFALVYSIGVAIFGGFAQFFATEAIVVFDSLLAPSYYLGAGALISLFAIPLFQEKKE